MYDVSAQGVYERMMNVHYYYYSYSLSLFTPELSRIGTGGDRNHRKLGDRGRLYPTLH